MDHATRKVLIIDDDSRNIFALKAVLKAKGYQCVTAISGMEGLKIMESDMSVAVVLLDMMMPEMDGYETLSHIRQGARKDLPVIAVTAQAMVGDRDKCIEAGATDYVSKPVDVDRLMALLNKFIY
ncbi:response regulator [Pseudochryseolinea flava]|uniref:Response regulator n=1 Tax=Pseudochryseolinea flava TaxID=2059302 RepID=A0A364Y228_9BACT|nr:response regulator [Pseudochryseolinea flava]RAW00020.1 response regulator [Pseudochryseolinea flava]